MALAATGRSAWPPLGRSGGLVAADAAGEGVQVGQVVEINGGDPAGQLQASSPARECCTITSRPLVMISSWPGKILTRRPHPRAACYRIAITTPSNSP
jgi:hypothetical protein